MLLERFRLRNTPEDFVAHALEIAAATNFKL
jgi:hypothetical protein